jgi:hypothetical protein
MALNLLEQQFTQTPQLYLTPRQEDVVVLAHHAEATRQAAERAHPAPAPGYRPETLDVLFGNRTVITTGFQRASGRLGVASSGA